MRTAHTFVLAVCLHASVCALAQSGGEDWRYAITPYLWLPTIGGDLNYELPLGGDVAPSVSAGPTDWLELLNFALLLGGSARNDRFSVSGDFVYLRLSKDSDGRVVSVGDPGSRLPIGAELSLFGETDLDGLLANLLFGYTLWRQEEAFVEVRGGLRYLGVDVNSRWVLEAEITTPDNTVVLPARGEIAQSSSLVDGLIGVAGQFNLGTSRWFAEYSADVGAGSSDLTWSALAALSYRSGWGDLLIGYRHLYYDQDSDGLLGGFEFTGPSMGVRIKF